MFSELSQAEYSDSRLQTSVNLGITFTLDNGFKIAKQATKAESSCFGIEHLRCVNGKTNLVQK